MNRLMQRMGADYQALVVQYEEIVNRCADEDRDPNDNETAILDGLRTEMQPLGERLIELRDTEDRRTAAVRAMGDGSGEQMSTTSGAPGSGLVHIRNEPEIYRRDSPPEQRQSFFRDLLHAQLDGDADSLGRLQRHSVMMRAAGTTTTGAGIIPPTWLFEEFAIIAHGARPWADALRHVGITDANPVNIGQQTSPGAAVTAQASENTAPNDGSFNAAVIPTQPKTYTGKVDVSRQLVDGSNPAVDSIIYADCMGSYNEQIEQAVVAAFEAASGFAATITYPGTAPVYTNLFDAFIDAAASVRKHRKASPKVVLCSEGAWAFMAKEKDQSGRPLVTTGYHGPVNAYGLGEAVTYGQIAGEVVGLQVIPSWAGVDNHVYVVKVDDSLLLESSVFNFRYEEVLGPESIRLGVWGYAAPVITRYPAAIAKIDAGSTIPAPQEDSDAGQAQGATSSTRTGK